MPANLIDLSISSEDVGTEAVLDSSADSVDSAGFFRRFADHMRAATTSRDAVYCKGATDYSFSQSPTADNAASSSVNRSILVQAGFDPAGSDDECPMDVHQSDFDPPFLIRSSENQPLVTVGAHPVASVTSGPVSTTPTITVSKASSRKRWSDFGTRLVGFVDKILLPEVDRKPASQMPSASCHQDARRSGSEEQLCSLSAAHAVGRRSAACRLGNQSDASDVIQMYSDIGRLQLQTGETQRTAATAAVSLEKSPFVARELTDDSVVR